MSFSAVNWAFEQEKMDAEARVILLTICNYMNEWGVSWPSQERFGKYACISRTTIWRRLNQLADRQLIAKIPRRSGQKILSDAYLIPGYDLLPQDDFNYSLGHTHMRYEDYIEAYKTINLNVSTVDVQKLLNVSNGDVLNVYPVKRNPNLNLNPDLKEREIREKDLIFSKNSSGKKLIFDSKNLVNNELRDKLDDLMIWLKNKKKLRHLPPQEYDPLFMELNKHGIDLDEFRDYYEWVEKQDWVGPTIGVALLIKSSTVEQYFNRNKVKEQKNGKQPRGSSMQKYLAELNERKTAGRT